MTDSKRAAAAAVSVVICVATLLAGCASSSGSRGGSDATFASPAVQMAEAREIAREATDVAIRANRAREAGRIGEADRLGEEAISRYRDALSTSRELPEAWNNLGYLLMQQKDYLQAADAFSVAMEMSPADPRPATNLGLVYFKAGWIEDSLQYYERALERSPNHPPALRGAIKASHLLSLADQKGLDRVRRALLVDRDETWRAFYEREKIRIEGRMESDLRGMGRRP